VARVIEIDLHSRGTDAYRRLLQEWSAVVLAGGVTAFPTDTVWGIGALASQGEAVERLYRLKGRRVDQPLACLVESQEACRRWVLNWPEPVVRLAKNHWPGPLTLVLPTAGIPFPAVQGDVPKLGFRVPDRQVLRDLLSLLKEPLATTSANLTGQPELSGVESICTVFRTGLDLIVSDMLTVKGVASTVAEWQDGSLVIIRQGTLALPRRSR
jgi:L-threonylcarbamoyladenylate synthase